MIRDASNFQTTRAFSPASAATAFFISSRVQQDVLRRLFSCISVRLTKLLLNQHRHRWNNFIDRRCRRRAKEQGSARFLISPWKQNGRYPAIPAPISLCECLIGGDIITPSRTARMRDEAGISRLMPLHSRQSPSQMPEVLGRSLFHSFTRVPSRVPKHNADTMTLESGRRRVHRDTSDLCLPCRSPIALHNYALTCGNVFLSPPSRRRLRARRTNRLMRTLAERKTTSL